MDTNKVKGGELGKKVVRFWDCLLDRGMFIHGRCSTFTCPRSTLQGRHSTFTCSLSALFKSSFFKPLLYVSYRLLPMDRLVPGSLFFNPNNRHIFMEEVYEFNSWIRWIDRKSTRLNS